MARTKLIQNSFNAGEWSPLLDGRTDLQKYGSAAKTLLNLICYKHGGIYRRPGTRFVAEVGDSTHPARLIPFQFSSDQAYVLEFSQSNIRFYKGNSRVESPPGTPVEIANPYDYTDDFFQINYAQSADVLFLTHASGIHPPYQLSRFSDTSWTIAPIAFTGGPWLDERSDISFTPDATTGAVNIVASGPFFDPGHDGALLRLNFGTDYGYVLLNSIVDSTHASGTVVVDFTASGSPSTVFQEGAWSPFRGFPRTVSLFQQRTWWGGSVAQPDTFWGSQVADYLNMDPGTGLDNEAINFTLASSRVNTARWIAPSRGLLVGTEGQEWIVSGGSDTSAPITPANPNVASETTHGSSTVSPLPVHNAILFLQRAGRRIREFSYQFVSDSYTAPDLTIFADHITLGGIKQMDYQQERDSIIWAIRGDGALIGLTYEKDQQVAAWHRQYTGPNGDLSDGQFESVACIPEPFNDGDRTWVIVNRLIHVVKTILDWAGDVEVNGITHHFETTILFHVPAHGMSPGDSIVIDGVVPSEYNMMATVNSVIDANHFNVIFIGSTTNPVSPILSGSGGIVRKTVGNKRYVEYLDNYQGYYGRLNVDCGLTYNGAGTDTIGGLDHLEGQVVDILGDGAVYPQQVVTNGHVVGLSPGVTSAEVGLHYDSEVETMRPEGGDDSGSAQGSRKRFNRLIARFDSSIGFTINGEREEFRSAADPMDQHVPLFTGDKIVTNEGWDTDGRVIIRQDQPLPFNLLLLAGEINVGD